VRHKRRKIGVDPKEEEENPRLINGLLIRALKIKLSFEISGWNVRRHTWLG